MSFGWDPLDRPAPHFFWSKITDLLEFHHFKAKKFCWAMWGLPRISTFQFFLFCSFQPFL